MGNIWKEKRSHPVLQQIVLPVGIFLLLLALFLYGLRNTEQNASREQLRSTQDMILRATVHCYAIEGMYAPSVEYLEEHYGVLIDHKKYMVNYETVGSNIMPQIQVFEKGW